MTWKVFEACGLPHAGLNGTKGFVSSLRFGYLYIRREFMTETTLMRKARGMSL